MRAMERYSTVERCLAAATATAAAAVTATALTAIECIQARRRLSACGLLELPPVAQYLGNTRWNKALRQSSVARSCKLL